MAHVFVAKHKPFGLLVLRGRKADSVDDRRMIQLVTDDDILIGQDGRNTARIRSEAPGENEHRLGVFELRQAGF